MAVTIQMGFKPAPCVMKANRNSSGFLSAVTTHREVLFAIYEPGPCWDTFELTYEQLWHNRYNLDTIKSKAILTLLCWDRVISMWTWYQMYGGLKLLSNWIKIVLHRSYNPCTLRPCDALWPHRCVSILVQVMACFLAAPLYPCNVKNGLILIYYVGQHMLFLTCVPINTSWPSDFIWRHRSEKTLVQIIACLLTTPSHSLN